MAIQSRTINGSLTEIYVGGGNFITQAFPTNFHQFWTKKILTSSENIEDFKEVTSAEKTTIEKKDREWKEPSKEFIAHMGARGVTYNTTTGFFKCNGINDLTISDARNIDIAYAQMRNARNAEFMFANYKFRTLPKVSIYVGGDSVSADRMFQICSTLESIDFSLINGFSLIHMMFRACSNLHTIKGLTMAQNIREDGASGAFIGCVKLRNVEIRKAKVNISFSDSPLLSLDSIQYLVANAANTTPITVTLHPDAYARLTDEIITAATAKQINFACPS